MKHLIVLTIALFSGIANARSIMMPVTTVQEISTNISSAELYHTGNLVVVNRRGLRKDLKLAPSVNSHLQGLAQSLAQAEIETKHQAIVCMMVPNPFYRRELSVMSPEGMRLVLSAQGCAYSDKTYPKEEYMLDLAKELRDKIVLLSQQLLKD